MPLTPTRTSSKPHQAGFPISRNLGRPYNTHCGHRGTHGIEDRLFHRCANPARRSREMHADSQVCIGCFNTERNKRVAQERAARERAEMRRRNHLWSLSLRAGWTWEELIEMRPDIPTMEQILQRAPGAVIRSFWEGKHGCV
jgi:hypothetical protein